jgi:hypothetical protein
MTGLSLVMEIQAWIMTLGRRIYLLVRNKEERKRRS